MDKLTRSQHPDLRLFSQVPGKLGWVSNRAYKTHKGAEGFLYGTVFRDGNNRRGIAYSIVVDRSGEYRILVKPLKKEGVQE